MPRFPYEQIAPEANRLWMKMKFAKDLKTMSYWWDVYTSFLEAVGWDPVSYDRATLERVDEDWEEKPKPVIMN